MEKLSISEPIKIIDVTEKGFNYGLWIPLLIAFISTSILIWNQVKTSKVYGKTISKTYSQSAEYSYYTNINEGEKIKGQQYLLKLSLSCLRKDLHFKDVIVNLHYGDEMVKGEIYYSKYNKLKMYQPDGKFTAKTYITPADNFLTFNNVLQADETSFYYLNFIVPGKEGAVLYDKLELIFIKPNDKKLTVQIHDIDPMQYLMEEELFMEKRIALPQIFNLNSSFP